MPRHSESDSSSLSSFGTNSLSSVQVKYSPVKTATTKPKKKSNFFNTLLAPFRKRKQKPTKKFTKKAFVAESTQSSEVALNLSKPNRKKPDLTQTSSNATSSNNHDSDEKLRTTFPKMAVPEVKRNVQTSFAAPNRPTPKPRINLPNQQFDNVVRIPPPEKPFNQRSVGMSYADNSERGNQPHLLVVEIVYHGRSLEPSEKTLVQSNVASMVDRILRQSSSNIQENLQIQAGCFSNTTPLPRGSLRSFFETERFRPLHFPYQHDSQFHSTPLQQMRQADAFETPQSRRALDMNNLHLRDMLPMQFARGTHEINESRDLVNASPLRTSCDNCGSVNLQNTNLPYELDNQGYLTLSPQKSRMESIQVHQPQASEKQSTEQPPTPGSAESRTLETSSVPRSPPSCRVIDSGDLINSRRLAASEPQITKAEKENTTLKGINDSMQNRTMSSNELLRSVENPCTPARFAYRNSPWRTPTTHDAWWMPREWAQERRIGAYRSRRRQKGEENTIRNEELEVAQNPYAEKIRTGNFVRI